MKCPVDGETLTMADRNGVEIDYCPKCRGVWLDRGELDKILERAAAPAVPPVMQTEPPRNPYQERPREYREEPRRTEYRDEYRDRDDRDHRRKYDDDDDHRYGKRKKRDSFLSDLFDF